MSQTADDAAWQAKRAQERIGKLERECAHMRQALALLISWQDVDLGHAAKQQLRDVLSGHGPGQTPTEGSEEGT